MLLRAPKCFGNRVPLLGNQEAEAEALEGRQGLLQQGKEDAAHQQGDQQGAGDRQPAEDPVAPGGGLLHRPI